MRTFLHTIVRRVHSAFRQLGGKDKALEAFLRNAATLAQAQSAHPALRAMATRGIPFISVVVPVYNTRLNYLDDLLASFRAQIVAGRSDGLFELVLSDDGSTSAPTIGWLLRHGGESAVRVVWNERNAGIAAVTNAGIRAARGEWVALLDHDDVIAPFALEQIARSLVDNPACKFLYTDEVITDGEMNPEGVFLKPAWDPVLLSGVNYVNHFSLYNRARLLEKGCLNEGFQGSQDYELLTRYTQDLQRDEVFHLPYPAYHWRRDGVSYSAVFLESATANARKALAQVYRAGEAPLEIVPALDPNLHRVDFAGARQHWPRVSVILPSRDALNLIRTVMDGLLNKTDYPDLEIIVVDNGTTDPAVLELYKSWSAGTVPFQVDIRPEPFNFSRAINRGVSRASGDILLILNNDIEMLEPGWLKEMVSCFEYPDTGVVGAKLLYPDRTLQHAGVIAGLGDLAGHWFIGSDRNFPGPMSRLMVRNSLSVVTGACMAVRRSCWERVGLFDEENFSVAYNDVDFCLRTVKAGYRVIWTPFAELVHHESATRGSDESPHNIKRFNREKANLKRLHATDSFEDPAFNPWYSRHSSAPAYRPLKTLPVARSGSLVRREAQTPQGPFCVLNYNSDVFHCVNLGDNIQSFPALQVVGPEYRFVNREDLSNFSAPVPHKIILNGWFMHRPEHWPPSPDLIPLPISIHITRAEDDYWNREGNVAWKRMLQPDSVAYLNRFGPVGARDMATLALLREHGVDAYFSGCLTLTLDRPPTEGRDDVIYCVDVLDSVFEYVKSMAGDVRVERLGHIDPEKDNQTRFDRAGALLGHYARARSVITTRLPCALPCLAFGTPVLYLDEASDSYRMDGLRELLHCATSPEVEAGTFDRNILGEIPNGEQYLPLRHLLKARVQEFLLRPLP